MKYSIILSSLTALMMSAGAAPSNRPKCGKVDTVDIDKLISEMTLEQKIAQRLLPDMRNWNYGGCSNKAANVEVMNDELAASISKYSFGGMVLFAENVVNAENATRLIDAMQKANAVNSKIPLFVGVDQEGGIVTRLGNGTMLPGNMAVGATGDPNNAYLSGAITGSELKAIGANVNFAPDADVNINYQNPVIGVRSFGSHADLVAKNAVQYQTGVKSAGCISCGKHFPGHGDTATDSHFGLPLVNKTLEQIQGVELVPFKALIANDVDMIMTAHIQYPALDDTTIPNIVDGSPLIVPATLSKKIMTDFLRGTLGFKGVSITDAMNMEAIISYVGNVDATARAIRAGVDVIIMPALVRCVANFTLYDDVINKVKKDIADKLYSEDELDTSIKRILTLKKKYNLFAPVTTTIEKRIEIANATLSDPKHKEIERNMARDAITLLKNDPTYGIPFKTDETSKVAVFMPDATQIASAVRTMQSLGVRANFTTFPFTNTLFNDTIKAMIDASTHVVIGSLVTKNTPAIDGGDIFIDTGKIGSWAYSFPAGVSDYAKTTKKPIAVISLRNPYDSANFERTTGAVLCAYGFKGYTNGVFGQPNLPAAISTVFGHSKPKGRLPVDIPSVFDNSTILYPFGFGLSL
ncbi:Beta-hexosaminidase [Zancudomyces culisetae]|uniref:beta-N-acetylhexosaminidase n=1 Tax=Zancudomyces culisetae TaxID=1213189 RepID=A0A1R1PXP3_ZANCU|nr:Beta-hexosaminidase [Zancudomyces culisetae]|eukprot:OMH85678.1 Beta-hexosaminidase [Zancudomyces culisetae]